MICKWCGNKISISDSTCGRCGRELPPLSDCGGFYDLIPSAQRPAAEPQEPRQDRQVQQLQQQVTYLQQQLQQSQQPAPKKRKGGMLFGIIASVVAVALAAALVVTALGSAKKTAELEEFDKVCAMVERLEKENAELKAALQPEATSPVEVPVDKTALEQAIAAAEAKNNADGRYTAGSWADLQTVLGEAQRVAGDVKADQEQVDRAEELLSFAMGEDLVDISELNDAVEKAKGLVQADYSDDDWTKLQTELGKAQAVLDDSDATQTDADTARSELSRVISALVKLNRDAYNTVMQKVSQLNEADYTAETWQTLTGAIRTAESATTQEALDEAVSLIEGAFESLEKLATEADRGELQSSVDKAEKLKKDESYTYASRNGLTKPLDDAKTALKNEDAAQTEVQAAKAKLDTALGALVKRGDKTDLQASVDKAEKLKKEDYSVESWSALDAALKNARAVLENKDATKAMVDDAKTKLDEAMDGLTVGKTRLQKLYEAANKLEDLEFEGYSAQWTTMITVRKEAGVLLTGTATQEEINGKEAALANAIAELLKPRLDEMVSSVGAIEMQGAAVSAELKAARDAAKELLEGLMPDSKTPDARNEYEIALDLCEKYEALKAALDKAING